MATVFKASNTAGFIDILNLGAAGTNPVAV